MSEKAEEQGGRERLGSAMGALWERARETLLARVATVRAAAEGARRGEPDEQTHKLAHLEAHRMAGSLGVFGMPEGTALAREMETLLESMPDAAAAQRLEQLSDELDALIQRGPASAG